MKTRTWMLALLSLGLLSCASSPASVDSHATDLELVRLGVDQLTRERQPQGAVTRAEDVTDTSQAFGLLISLEDTNWLQNDDKRRVRDFVHKATYRIELGRLPTCRWVWDFRCRRERKAIQERIDAADKPSEH